MRCRLEAARHTPRAVLRTVAVFCRNLETDPEQRLQPPALGVRPWPQILVNPLSNAVKFTEAGGSVALKIA